MEEWASTGFAVLRLEIQGGASKNRTCDLSIISYIRQILHCPRGLSGACQNLLPSPPVRFRGETHPRPDGTRWVPMLGLKLGARM